MEDRDVKSRQGDNFIHESQSWNTIGLASKRGSKPVEGLWRKADAGVGTFKSAQEMGSKESSESISAGELAKRFKESETFVDESSALAVVANDNPIRGKQKEKMFGEIDDLANLFTSGSISGQSKDNMDKPEDGPSWNSSFAVRVLFVISVTQYCGYVLSALSHVHTVSGLGLAKTQWVMLIPISIYVVASMVSVLLSWGRQYPTNVCIIMVFVTCSALIWMLLTLTVSSEVVPQIVECIATSCLFLALFLMMNVDFDIQGATVFIIGGGIIIVHLMIRMCVAILQFEGKHGSLNWVFAQVCAAHIFASLGFGYVIFDLQAILQGSRGIAWPNQWLYGVISVYQDIVLLTLEGIKMLQYLAPCTYCKDGVHTIWKRWKFQKM